MNQEQRTKVRWKSCSVVPATQTAIVEFELLDERLQGETELLVHVPIDGADPLQPLFVDQARLQLRSILKSAIEEIDRLRRDLH